jgi:hypothetical protein
MRIETSTQEDRPPRITPAVPWRVQEVKLLEDYRLYVKFKDGLEGFVNLHPLIFSGEAGVFISLRDPLLFKRVYLNQGAVSWPGELDLAPDAMYEAIKANGEWTLS